VIPRVFKAGSQAFGVLKAADFSDGEASAIISVVHAYVHIASTQAEARHVQLLAEVKNMQALIKEEIKEVKEEVKALIKEEVNEVKTEITKISEQQEQQDSKLGALQTAFAVFDSGAKLSIIIFGLLLLLVASPDAPAGAFLSTLLAMRK
jgi:hypothetical protein